MSSNKNETAVHGCNPAISVPVVLLSHKVYFLRSMISLAVLFVIYCRRAPKIFCRLSNIADVCEIDSNANNDAHF